MMYHKSFSPQESQLSQNCDNVETVSELHILCQVCLAASKLLAGRQHRLLNYSTANQKQYQVAVPKYVELY